MVHQTYSRHQVASAAACWINEQLKNGYKATKFFELLEAGCIGMCQKWFKDNPQRASGLRAITCEPGELPYVIQKAAAGANVCARKLREDLGLPCEFSIFMDPDGCTMSLKWGLRSREEDHCELFPRNQWDAYCEIDLPQRLQEYGTVIVSQVKDEKPLKQQHAYFPTARNTTPSPPYLARYSPVTRYSPTPPMGRPIVRTTPKSSYRSSSPDTPTSDVVMFDSSVLDTGRCGDVFMPSFTASYAGELGIVSS